MKKILLTAISLIALTGSGVAYGVSQTSPTGADEVPPIVAQVENHEERIGDLETKTDNTQTQVNQNTADIGSLQNNTGTAPADTVEPVHTTVAQPTPSVELSPSPELEPEPEPEPIDPHTITAVTDTPDTDLHNCFYTLYNGTTKSVYTGNQLECYALGTILPSWLWPK